MRKRTIKPEFRTSQALGNVSRNTRLLYVLMHTICDDDGRMPGNHRFLAHELFPYDTDVTQKNIATWCSELQREELITQYVADRAEYIEILHFRDEQRPDHYHASKLPAASTAGQTVLNFESLPPSEILN